jgi:hypothetical protein
MVTKQKREAYYRRVYGDKTFKTQNFQRDLDWYFQAVDNEGKKIGRPIKKGADAHKLLAKMYPKQFPPVDGFVAGKQRLVRASKANITRNFKANDWNQYGFPTAKAGKEFVNAIRTAGHFFSHPDMFSKVVERFQGVSADRIRKILHTKSNNIKAFTKEYLAGVQEVDTTDKEYKGSARAVRFFTKGNMALRKNGFYDYFNRIKPLLIQRIRDFMIQENSHVGFWITTTCSFKNEIDPSKEDEKSQNFMIRTTSQRVLGKANKYISKLEDINIAVDRQIKQTIDMIEEHVSRGSGWVLSQIKDTYLNVFKYTPKSGRRFFDIPKWLTNVNSLYIPKNSDDLCAWYCLVYAVEDLKGKMKNASRITELRKIKNMFETKYPIDPSLFPLEVDFTPSIHTKLEDLFQSKIHIWFAETTDLRKDADIHVETRSKNTCYSREVDLILLQHPATKERHFAYCKNIRQFVRHDDRRSSSHTFVCRNCSRIFYNDTEFQRHHQLCINHETTTITMPKKGAVQSFKQHSSKIPVPYVIIWDCETYNLTLNEQKENTTYISRHVPTGAFAVVHDTLTNKVVKTFKHHGATCIGDFINEVRQYCDELVETFFNNAVPLRMTKQNKEDYHKATHCYVCEDPFASDDDMSEYRQEMCHVRLQMDTKDEKQRKAFLKENKPVCPKFKVKDHCHFTGEFRGACCYKCNLQLKVRVHIPAFAHNFKGYDSHFFIDALTDKFSDKVDVIPQNTERFLEARVDLGNGDDRDNTQSLVFKDSLCHLSSSLDTLAKNLADDDLVTTKEFIRSLSKDDDDFKNKFDLCKIKGAYAYDYFDDMKKFEDTKIPDVEFFVSCLEHHGLKFSQLSETDKAKVRLKHKRAVEVFTVFEFKNLWEWHDHYMMLDVYLLNDVWNKYRKTALSTFGLDPSYYPTLPSFCWQAMLKVTGEKLELITDHDIYMMLEKGKIGGISMVGTKRYAKANNPMLKSYDKNAPTSYIKYADVNGLYSWAMKQLLPHSGFRMMDKQKFNLQEALDSTDGITAYFLEVDFPLPKELHDKFRDYPILPENLTITDEMLSPLQHKIKDQLTAFNNYHKSNVQKLVPNLYDKKNYVIHIKHLKLALELCEGLVKPEDIVIHKVLAFEQKAWLKPYIDMCMKNRQASTNDFDKDYYKLCANSVFGKTMENVRDRMKLHFLTDPASAEKYLNDFRFSHYEIRNGTMAVYQNQHRTTLNKPIYAGVAILNLSKYLMYDIWYNKLKRQYGDNITLLYTDTDSFIFEVFTDDFDRDIDPNLWDNCDYPPDHPLFSTKNKKIEGKIKDETHGVPISEFSGNRAKQYANRLDYSHFHTSDNEWLEKHPQKIDKCVGKGIAKSILEKSSFIPYYDAIHHNYEKAKMCQYIHMYGFKSEHHKVYTINMRKSFTSSFDDKRYILDDGIHQLPYGHYKIS